MSWNIPLLLLHLKSICSICHVKIGKVPVSRIDAIWNKGRHVYVSKCTDWPLNWPNRPPSWCTVQPSLAKAFSKYILINQISTTTLYEISLKLSHINYMEMIHREQSTMVDFSSTHMSKASMGGTLLLSIRFETMISNNIVTPHHLCIATIQMRILLYMTHTTKPGLTTACSHFCQSSGWTPVKTTATYKSIPSTRILVR